MGSIRTAVVGEPTLQDVRRAMFEVSGELASQEKLFTAIGSIGTRNAGGPARVERVLVKLTDVKLCFASIRTTNYRTATSTPGRNTRPAVRMIHGVRPLERELTGAVPPSRGSATAGRMLAAGPGSKVLSNKPYNTRGTHNNYRTRSNYPNGLECYGDNEDETAVDIDLCLEDVNCDKRGSL